MASTETFKTTYRAEYNWPYSKPVTARPAAPPLITKPENFYMARPLAAYCHCDWHLYDPQMNRYKRLAEREWSLQKELMALSKELTQLSNGVLDHPCDTYDDKMKSIYQSDYIKRGLKLTQYIPLMAAVDAPDGVPVREHTIGLLEGYRDPTNFRFNAIQRPTILSPKELTFSRTPEMVEEWFTPRTGRSEYQDTFSKMGLGIMKNRQQYMEPLPSSRRRYEDPCL